MQTILLVIHLLIAISLVGVILLQKSEGGALGIGGSGGMNGGLFSARGTANLLTRMTALLATAFIITSLLLAIISGRFSDNSTGSIIDGTEQGTNGSGLSVDAFKSTPTDEQGNNGISVPLSNE